MIAQGGMGFVELYGRKRGPFIRWFARKRMHPEWRTKPEFRRMFYDEARLAHLIRGSPDLSNVAKIIVGVITALLSVIRIDILRQRANPE
jgi:hypothetical protein